ncbi:oxalate/formate antiporter [Poseidonocella pacifica]|uniref:Oxalate/formate antiporter n=1 Tax=Poseidonocella pacifica TaxID=871651 RepID=A0A1I0WQ63_9RHOB|nr:oxalate/formate MFS antiporter [Poseidonocella pacifica]SFA90328.1 oxalate/formate antiporter [Poseidonocella pacifica]
MSDYDRAPVGEAGLVPANRWLQLVAGVACMVAASNVQYSWTLFVPAIQEAHDWSRAAIQTAFTIFVLCQTWSTPLVGHFIDKHGPRALVMLGGILIAIAWIINSMTGTLSGFYLGGAIGGFGVACVYSSCINNALKWFPDKRGLAVGLTAGGYGAGTIFTIIPIRNMIESTGYSSAFFTFALIQGVAVFALAWLLKAPRADQVVFSDTIAQTRRNYTLQEALQTPVFWVMLAMFTATVTGGLMAVAQLGPMAEDLGVKDQVVFWGMAALPLALMLDRVMNGLSRPLFGYISDRIGREPTMFIAFSLEGIGIFALAHMGHNPYAFVLLSGLVFIAWGEVYSLFSATASDVFGTKHIGKIYGALYTAKGIAALLVPVGNLVMEATGGWTTVLLAMACLDAFAAICAIAVLRPMIKRHHMRNGMTEADLKHSAVAH